MDTNGSRISVEEDSDDDFQYEEVEVDVDDEDIDEGEDLETALIKVRQQQQVGECSRITLCHPPPPLSPAARFSTRWYQKMATRREGSQ
jgi:hypothetical protein